MRKYFSVPALLLSVLMILSGCSTFLAVTEKDASIAEPTAAPTAPPTSTPSPEPTAEPTSTLDPAKALQDCVWIAYHDTEGVEYFVFELTFHADGTMEYMAGWYRSEIAYYGTGTYTADAETIQYALSDGATDLAGSVSYTLSGNTLTLSPGSGDLLMYLLESESLTFAVKGSAEDTPPFSV